VGNDSSPKRTGKQNGPDENPTTRQGAPLRE